MEPYSLCGGEIEEKKVETLKKAEENKQSFMSDSQKMKDDRVITVEINTISETGRQHRVDSVVRETETRLKVDGRLCSQLFCLPYHFEEFAIGYLTTGGLDPAYIANIEVKKVDPAVYEILVTLEKEVYRNPLAVNSQLRIKKEDVFAYVNELEEGGILFKATGGTHVVASFSRGSDTILIEDVSRHCAIDKLVGACITKGIAISESVLMTSCRQTYTTVKKEICAGFPITISVSAPTTLAVKEADEFGMTLVGFARDKRFNVYTNDWRIV
jgi:FdhD protein